MEITCAFSSRILTQSLQSWRAGGGWHSRVKYLINASCVGTTPRRPNPCTLLPGNGSAVAFKSRVIAHLLYPDKLLSLCLAALRWSRT